MDTPDPPEDLDAMPRDRDDDAARSEPPVPPKLFGWLGADQLLQLGIMLTGMAAGYAYLSSDVRVHTRELAETRAKVEVIAKSVGDVGATVQTAATINAQQQGEIGALQQSRDADRKLLMDINANIAVLLDRTDPRKASHP